MQQTGRGEGVLWANNRLRLVVTNECNLSCFYCHNEGQPKSSDFLSFDLFAQILRLIGSGSRDLDKVTFSGGEPLLHPRLESFVRELSPMARFGTIVTNGLLLDERRLNSLRMAGVTKFRIGADSLTRHRSRPSAVFPNGTSIHQTIELLERTSTPFELNVVLTEFNRSEIPEIVRFCRDHKVSAKFFEHVRASFVCSEFAVLDAEAEPRVPFSEFSLILSSVMPTAIQPSEDVFDGANELYNFDGFSIRYCRYLCPYGLCHLTGTRIDPRGFVYACLVGNGRFRIFPDQTTAESATTIAQAVDWGCSSRLGSVPCEPSWKEAFI
jgi:cyclic pyranopterin phosphate synthase